MAWKSGTSRGHRDALAIGMCATHSVAVWAGRPDGAPIAAGRHRREALWLPDGPGFYRVTVIDAEGAAAAVELRVR